MQAASRQVDQMLGQADIDRRIGQAGRQAVDWMLGRAGKQQARAGR